MKYVKSFDHFVLAHYAFAAGNVEKANEHLSDALKSDDIGVAIRAMSDYNKASDVGVQFEVPGGEFRVLPGENQQRKSQEAAEQPNCDEVAKAEEPDGDEAPEPDGDEVEASSEPDGDECVKEPVTSALKRLTAASAPAQPAPSRRSQAIAAKAAPATPSARKHAYFASMK